jgi:Na+/H+-dicarboxylate symporter
MDCMDSSNISRRISHLVAPLGACINLDGMAMCEVLAAFLVIDSRNVEISAAIIAIIVYGMSDK